MRKKQFLIVFIVIGLMSFASMANAQGVITNGSGTVGALSPQAPLAVYSYQTGGSEQITVQVLGLTPGLAPTISAISGTGAQLGLSNTDPLSPGTNSARLTVDAEGVTLVTFIVSSQTGATGDFALRLDAVPISPPENIDEGSSSVEATAGNNVFSYIVPGLDVSQIVTVSTGSPDVNFTVNAYLDTIGAGFATGNSAQPATMILSPAETDYIVRVFVSALADATIDVSIAPIGEPVAEATEVPPTQPPVPVEATPTATVISTTEQAPTEEATVEDVATEEMNTATMIPPTDAAPTATLVSPTATVVPVEATPTATVVQPTATYTATYTPSYTPTATYTPSYTPTTPPPAQTAPEDARFNSPLDVPLDNTVSVLDFVSYPQGDTEDRVRYSVTGMNPNSSLSGGRARLVIAVSCFGEGTEHIQFFTGGQTYTCGQTIVDQEVTADSNTGSVVITAVGGDATYVQWVLTGTATRVN